MLPPMMNRPMQNRPMQNQPMQQPLLGQRPPMQNRPMQNAPMQQPLLGQRPPMQSAPMQNVPMQNMPMQLPPRQLAGGGYVQSANRFPVMLHSEGGAVGYAEGGLHDEAMAVRRAGRGGDSRLVHVNDDEFRQMKAEYGEPTINPETGMPEFFLGKFGKILKKLAPLAAFAIPFAGPAIGTALGIGSLAASAGLGAGLGALSGGGVKGALLGGLTGGLGASGAAGKIGSTVLGSTASAAAKNALGNAVISGGLGAAQGEDPLTSAIGGAATGFLGTKLGSGTPSDAFSKAFSPEYMKSLADASAVAPDLAVKSAAAEPNWWNRDVGFLGKTGKDLGIQNKHAAIAGGLLAAGALDAMKKKGQSRMTEEEFFGDRFSGGLPEPRARLRSSTTSAAAGPLDSYYSKGYAPEYKYSAAKGGVVPKKRASSFAVTGPGTGRSDDIPAMLSDGEYVIDAETVALLGDGSTKAGAKRLDDFRIEIRKQKGSKLAKGKISRDAKAPVRYMVGGRI